jgi:hypothetical protein
MTDRGLGRDRAMLAGSVALVVVVALVAQFTLPLNADAQWILMTAERVVRGQRLYQDILEINPPLVVWLDIPIVWLAHVTDAAAAVIFRLAIVLAAVAAASFTASSLAGLISRRQLLVWALPILLGVLLILPGAAFGQREQLITILLLPYLAVTAGRLGHQSTSTRRGVAAGVAAGVAISLKPHFLLVWLLVSGGRAMMRRPRSFRPENEDVTILVTGLSYLLAVSMWAPGFFPLATTFGPAYLAYTTMTRLQILGQTAAIIWLGIAIIVWRVRRSPSWEGPARVLALAGVGSAGAAVWQGKGWTYHFLPVVSFAVLLGVAALCSVPDGARRRSQALVRLGAAVILIVCWVPLVGGVAWQLTRGAEGTDAKVSLEQRELAGALASERGARSILVLSADMTASQPWIEESGLVSRNSFPCLWVPAVAYHTRWNDNPRIRLRSPAEMSAAERAAYNAVVRDFTIDPPDLLIVESRSKNERFTGYPGGFDHLAYYGEDPRFAACLTRYRLDTTLSGFQVLRRAAAGAAASPHGMTQPPTPRVCA